MGNGTADFFLTGDFLFEGKGCALTPSSIDFLDANYSQIVVSESSATCFANQIARSNLGQIILDKNRLRQFLNYGSNEDFTIDSLSEQFPLLLQIADPITPIKIRFTFRKFKIAFGKEERDIVADYTVSIDLILLN